MERAALIVPLRWTRRTTSALLLATALAATLTACGGDGGGGATDPSPPPASPGTAAPTPSSPTTSGTPSTVPPSVNAEHQRQAAQRFQDCMQRKGVIPPEEGSPPPIRDQEKVQAVLRDCMKLQPR